MASASDSARADPDAAAPSPPLGVWSAVATAFVVGFGVMAAELTAVRLLAPFFGDSAYVWTNVIGVILAAMALGATLGGRLAGRADAARWPVRLLLVGALLMLLSTFLAPRLGDWLIPDDLPLDTAMAALIRGSLVAAGVLFAPPLLLLAAVSPLLIVLLARSGVGLGRAAGDIAAAGTIGSLLGTFAATHWLVPGFGSRLTLTITAGMLAGTALFVAAGGRRRRRGAIAAVLVIAAAGALHGGPLRPAPVGRTLLAERETAYQFLQVLEDAPPDRPARTTLVINEGLDSFHSLAIAGSAFTGGAYYDWHAVAPLLAGDGTRPPDLRALSVGDAAGTLRTIYAAVHPGAEVDAVDIDAATMALGDSWFAARKAPGQRHAIDGRVFLAHTERRWHVVHVDAYAHQVYVPAHLASREFFVTARDHLLEGGVLACNVGALDRDDAVLRAIATTMADVFGQAQALLVPNSRNALLVARRDAALAPASLAGFEVGGEASDLGDADLARWRDLVAACADPDAWLDVGSGGELLTDDRPVLDELLFDSYLDHHDPERLVGIDGATAVAAAEVDAYEAARRGHWSEVLAAVARSDRPSAYLRQLAGDARWRMRQLVSATLEYRAGLDLEAGPELTALLADRLARAEDELVPIRSARAAATRNGWLAALLAMAALALGVALRLR